MVDTVEKALYGCFMQKSKEYCWICDDYGFTYETNPYDPEDIVKEIIKEGEETINIIENKILNKENPDTKEEKEEELDIEIEWDDENPKK